ncbi:hypothetical protein EJ04DRAFT_527656 [Polyplosphaeria fusca]|uniref:Uncharacterized protein n=1 Tax=Polyplosphaeria fusca TaxID=682080 RepID=A0A9P4QR83_9PLEO|nr:hypothetical protein EJ04DRAFT_527656 [Polyplosphaeria fusca]
MDPSDDDKGKGSKDSYASRYGSAAPNQPAIPVISVTAPDENQFADDFMTGQFAEASKANNSAAFGPEQMVNRTSPFAGMLFLQDNRLLPGQFAEAFKTNGSAAFGPERMVNSTSPFAGFPFLQDNRLLPGQSSSLANGWPRHWLGQRIRYRKSRCIKGSNHSSP